MELSPAPLYLATARVWDDDFRHRVERHRADRSPQWRTIEIEKNISAIPIDKIDQQTGNDQQAGLNQQAGTGRQAAKPVVVLDCITLWITNFFSDNNGDVDKTLESVRAEWDRFAALPITIIAISNEVGMGLHPQTQLGLKFVDLQGFVNQYIAKTADTHIFMVSGRPLYVPA